jgi:hypothetical protein
VADTLVVALQLDVEGLGGGEGIRRDSDRNRFVCIN